MAVADETVVAKDERIAPDSIEARGWIFNAFRYDLNGHGHFTHWFDVPGANKDSAILAHITEMKLKDGVLVPHMGVATLSVANIAFDVNDSVPSCRVRGAVAFDSNIQYRITLFVVV
ncbi:MULTISPECIES: hypothetical protein [unclassified Streptomyces]|uniref:hypothetical protein n=1 Tax=unclassified Streptomyces TaxID=2593676 RepID=UPI00288562A6|nr:hypothetical protein [Streptomyces sp. DSM 41633]